MDKELNVAAIKDWLGTTRKVIAATVQKAVVSQLRSYDPEDMFDDTISYLVDTSYEMGCSWNKEEWDFVFDRAFKKIYSTIRTFHACRTSDVESYKRRGLLRLSPDLLRELAHASFSRVAPTKAIDEAVEKTKLQDFQRRVYLFTDTGSAKQAYQNHYLQCGSEVLQGLASDLGVGRRGVLASQGKPCLIECSISLTNVEQENLSELWRLMVTTVFQMRAGGEKITAPPEFSIRTNDDVPSEQITQFIMLEDDDLEYNLPRH